jgi:hypothetical protein
MLKSHFLIIAAVVLFVISGLAFGEIKKPTPQASSVEPQNVRPVEPIKTDLALADIFLDENCNVWVTWQNKGNVRIDKVLRERVEIIGTPHISDAQNHVVLEPGALFSHAFGSSPVMKVSGTKAVKAIIDSEYALAESNETNNTLTKTLTCPKRP